VSLLMIGQQAIMDAYLCLLHLTAGILVGMLSVYLSCLPNCILYLLPSVCCPFLNAVPRAV
jgi:hypothetical protein